MKKKAIAMQFHWIFILVAGAIILAFFFSLVQKQRVLSQEKLSITLATDMEAVFSGAIESKGTAQPLVIPRTGIAFSCSQACECNFWIGNKATEFREKIIFAPDLIADQDAIAWADEFKMPFRISYNLQIPLQSFRQGQQLNIPFHRLHCKEWVPCRICRLHRSINGVGILSSQRNSHITAPRPRLILNLSLRPCFPLPPPLNPPSLKNLPAFQSPSMQEIDSRDFATMGRLLTPVIVKRSTGECRFLDA